MAIRQTVPAVVAADGWFNQTEAVSIAPAEQRQSLVTGVAAHGSQTLDGLPMLVAQARYGLDLDDELSDSCPPRR